MRTYAVIMELAREPIFRLGGMEVRPSTREIVFESGREVLEPQVMAVLIVLARAKGEVVTRDDLTTACWDGRVVSDDAINRVISRIRRASDLTGGKDFTLETITKVGYRLVAKQAETAPPVASPETAAGIQPAIRKRHVSVIAALAVLAVLVATGAWWLAGREPEWQPDPKRSLTLAVLPFDNLGTTPEDSQLATGMAREIRNTLSRVRGLRVVSDASSFALASQPLGEIRDRLHADLVLDGGLSRSGDTLKLSVELVDGWKGVNLWTGSATGPAGDLEQLRQKVAASVVEQLVLRLGPDRVEMLAPPRREDPRVYRMLMDAWALLESTQNARMRGRADLALDAGDKANALIDEALRIDPESPMGLGFKARVVSMGATSELFKQGIRVPEKAAQAASYLRRALASDPDAAGALGALGEYYRRFEWRWEEARTMLQRTLALDPNNQEAHLSYAYYLSGVGRCIESLEHARTAIEIDPEFGWRTLGVPRALKCLGRFEESDAAYMAAITQDRANMFILREMYVNYLTRRDPDRLEKLRAYVRDDLWKGKPEPEVQKWLDWTASAVTALRGDTAPFVALIEKDVRANSGSGEDPQVPVEINRGKGDIMWIQAIEFAVAGKPSRAIDLLDGALAASTLYIPETMPFGLNEFSPEVRADPRYQALWRNDPRLVELVRLRLESLKAGQMAGVLPDGTTSIPQRVVDTRS